MVCEPQTTETAFGVLGIKGTSSAHTVSQAMLFLIGTGHRTALTIATSAMEKYLLNGRGREEVIVPYFAYWCALKFLGREEHPEIKVVPPYDKVITGISDDLSSS